VTWPARVGRYQITGELGRGAMGVVLRGVDPALERPVAIKLIAARATSGVSTEEMEARFLREARVAARINHPGVVTVFDAGREGASLFLVMELIEGESLGDKLARGEYPDPATALEMVARVGEALAAAHSLGVIHRDVKPSNVMITTDGRVKVADFGVAKAMGEDTNLTRTGTVVGSPAYMAPEQVRGQQLDGRSDLFSLGVVLYELLLHRKPFPSETVTTLIYQILHEDPLSSPEISRALGDDVAALLRRCLSKVPEERFPDGVALAGAARAVGARFANVSVMATQATGARHAPPETPSAGAPSPASSQQVRAGIASPTAAVQGPGASPSSTRTAGIAAQPVVPPFSTGTAPASTYRPGTTGPDMPATGAGQRTGTGVGQSGRGAGVEATSPTRAIAVVPMPPVTAEPVAPSAPGQPVRKSSPLPVILVLLLMVLVVGGLAGFLGLRYLRSRSGGGEQRPEPTVAVAVMVTPTAAGSEAPTQSVAVATPLPTFTPTEIPVLPTPTQVAVAWSTAATPTPWPTYAFPETHTAEPSATSVPTEPPVVATFRASEGVKFSTSPDAAELWVKGTLIGTADDWDDMGGGKVWEPGRGTHLVRMTLKGYKTVWIKVIIDPAAKEDVGDVDTDLEESN
jgi:eukaryotic-like serine/threonine-protein kinase